MTEAAPQKASPMVRWLMVWMVFAVAAVSYLDRNNISIAASAIQKDFHLSNVQLGAVFSAFVMGYALSQPLAGRLADRFGPYRTIAFGAVWWSVFSAATALAPFGLASPLFALISVRFLLGIGEAVIFPASNRLVANWIPANERGMANGIIFAGVGVGAGVAPPLITGVIRHGDWRAAFFASAAIGLVALAIWLFVVRDRPQDHPWVDARERNLIEAGRVAGVNAQPASWLQILANPSVRILSASYFTYGYVAYIFFTWFFRYLSVVRGLNLAQSALFGMLPFIAMAIASPLGGLIGDSLTPRFGVRVGRCWTAAGALTLTALFVGLATTVADARASTIILALGAGSLYLSQSAYWTLSANLGGASSGAVSGVMNLFNQLGGVVTAMLTPWIADRFGWNTSFLFAAALCLLGAAAWLALDPDKSLSRS